MAQEVSGPDNHPEEEIMESDCRPGAVHWIDHFVAPTNSMIKWEKFVEEALGGHVAHKGGLSTGEYQRGGYVRSFYDVGRHEIGGFLQLDTLPAPRPLGQGLPRYGFFVRREEIPGHLRRFDELGVEHSDPMRISDGGDEGTVVYFRDPDANEFELWAPNSLPPGAMDSRNPTGLGRLSHVVLESRDLDRTLDFHGELLALDPIYNADIPKDRLVLRLAGGGRIVFQKVDADAETRGGQQWFGVHSALTIRTEHWDDAYDRVWARTADGRKYAGYKDAPDIETRRQLVPPFTSHPGSVLRGEWGDPTRRGENFCDWDNNEFHFTRGKFAPGETSIYETVPGMAAIRGVNPPHWVEART
jgi:catechol 2,3-dioxygenase-like lactoylglutathione lyase family enzyme